MRDNAPYGQLCEVAIPVGGLRSCGERVANVTTAWELRDPDSAPRLVSAYIEG